MVVTTPHHIEFVNQYVHQGKAEQDEDHLSPLKILGMWLKVSTVTLGLGLGPGAKAKARAKARAREPFRDF